MTEKLFYKNVYLKEFKANILDVTEKDNKYYVELDKTAFYPEGGGQPCDLGKINDIPVLDVFEDEDKIIHVTANPINVCEVNCEIDWQRRFDHMQQHLGQHILSATLFNLFKVETVGFHLTDKSLTIDINKVLDNNQLEKVEIEANKVVFNNLEVSTIYPSKDELKSLPLRKLPPTTENVRVVKIEEIDFSPCCGTHLKKTGEVGLIKIKKSEKYKSGIRIEFVCGNRALKDYSQKNEQINKITSLLSLSDNKIIHNIETIWTELIDLRKQNNSLNEQLNEYEATELLNKYIKIGEYKIIKNVFTNRDLKDINMITSKLVSNSKVIVLFGIQNINTNKSSLIFSRSKDEGDVNMSNILKECISIINGRGGGTEFNAQGGGSDTSNVTFAVETAFKLIEKMLINN